MKFPRLQLSNIEKFLNDDKAIIIYGPRQVGKSTLIKDLKNKLEDQKRKVGLFDLEDLDNLNIVENSLSQRQILNNFGEFDAVIFDEAQKFNQIGKLLKLFVDYFPKIRVLATGSSSFELANQTSEALTGRKYEFQIFPISLEELAMASSRIEVSKKVEEFLVFGLYPEILNTSINQRETKLKLISQSYLYQDILSFERHLNSNLIKKILKLIALQIGSEVSYNEIATQVGVSQKTIESYIDIFEKSFILKVLPALSNNPRKEITKKKKIYFWDLGIRNSLVEGFNSIDTRGDVGALWENFCVMERVKHLQYKQLNQPYYFWRNYNQVEIDWVEEINDQNLAFEFKYNQTKKAKLPTTFSDNYKVLDFQVIHKNNFWELIN